MASNHQNLTPIKGLVSFLVVVYIITLKNSIFVKSLNFEVHGTPLTADAARNAVWISKVREKLSDLTEIEFLMVLIYNISKYDFNYSIGVRV